MYNKTQTQEQIRELNRIVNWKSKVSPHSRYLGYVISTRNIWINHKAQQNQ